MCSLGYYLNKIPIELKEYIFKLTYKKIDKNLLTDIIDFSKSKANIINKYSNYTNNYSNNTFNTWNSMNTWNIPQNNLDNIQNDLLIYMNSNLHMILGYSEKMEQILIRSNLIISPEDIDLYIFVLNKKKPSQAVNILLGLLTPNERLDFINNY
jgi:hypothetical protein